MSAYQRLTNYKADLLGVAELAMVLGISKQAVSNRLARDRLPTPDARLALGPVWYKESLLEFVKAYTIMQP